jgi:L-fucose isomerase-like protein
LKLGVLFLGRKRPGFDQEWASRVEREVRSFLASSPYGTVIPEKVTDDSSLRRAIEECRGGDVLVALQTTMSDGRLAPALGRMWEGPVVLWATPERQEGDRVSSCSLVGTHIFASIFRQMGRPFELVYGSPGEERTARDLDEAVRVACAARRISGARVGLIGYQAPGFIDMHADPFEVSRVLGTRLHHVGLQELVDLARSTPDEEVREDVERVMEMGLPFEGVTEEDLPVSSRLYLSMRRIVEEEGLDALAVREWPELPEVMGQWAYLAMLRLTMEGVPTAMEGDFDGAITALAGQELGFGAAYLSDWLEHDDETVTLWHMGNAPFDLCEPVGSERGPRLAKHFNIPKPLVVNADLEVGMPVTVCRMWRCDGRYLITARHAETIPPRRHLLGTNALARVEGGGVRAWFEELCYAGMPHHVAVFRGRHEGLLRRYARRAGIGWVG